MTSRRFVIPFLLAWAAALAACSPTPSAPTATPTAPTATPTRPAATATPTASVAPVPLGTATPLPGPAITVPPEREGTPAPRPVVPISLDTVGQVQMLAQWGKGFVRSLSFADNGAFLRVATSADTYYYDVRAYDPVAPSEAVLAEFSPSPLDALSWTWVGGNVEVLRDNETAAVLADAQPPVAFSADARLAVAQRGPGEAAVWDLTTGEMLRVLAPEDQPVACPAGVKQFALTGDGGLIAAACLNEHAVRVWQAGDGLHLRTFDAGSPAYGLSFSPDGSLLAAITADGDVVLWQVRSASPSPVRRLRGAEPLDWQQTGMTVFAPSGAYLAAAFQNGEVVVWRVEDGMLVGRPHGRAPTGQALQISAEPWRVAAGASDAVLLWEAASGEALTVRRSAAPAATPANVPSSLAPSGTVLDLALAPNGQTLFAVMDQWPAELRQWQVGRDGARPVQPAGQWQWLRLAYSPDGAWLAGFGGPGGLEVRAAADGAQVFSFTVPLDDPLVDVVFATDAPRLAALSRAGVLRLFDTETWQPAGVARLVEAEGRRLAIFPRGEYVAALGEKSVEVWDLRANQRLYSLSAPAPNPGAGVPLSLSAVQVSPGGALIATGDHAGQVCLWRASDGILLRILTGHAAIVHDLAFSPDGRLLVSSAADGTVRLWGVRP